MTRASTRRLSGLCSVTLLWARRCSMSRCSTPPLSIGWRTGRLCVGAGRHRLRAPSPIRLRCCVLRSRSGCGPCGAESRRVSRRLRGLRGTGAPLGQGWALLRAGSAHVRAGAAVALRPTAGATRRVRRRIRRPPWSTDGLRRRTGSAWAAGRVRPAATAGRFRPGGACGRRPVRAPWGRWPPRPGSSFSVCRTRPEQGGRPLCWMDHLLPVPRYLAHRQVSPSGPGDGE